MGSQVRDHLLSKSKNRASSNPEVGEKIGSIGKKVDIFVSRGQCQGRTGIKVMERVRSRSEVRAKAREGEKIRFGWKSEVKDGFSSRS